MIGKASEDSSMSDLFSTAGMGRGGGGVGGVRSKSYYRTTHCVTLMPTRLPTT